MSAPAQPRPAPRAQSPLPCFLSLILVATAFCLACQEAHGQAQPGASVPEHTVRATTRLVLVDVIVTGSDGAPMEGLSAKDFVLLEGGKQQKIAVFLANTTQELAQQSAAVTKAQAALPPHVVTNSPAYSMPQGPLVVLLLDALNTPAEEQMRLRQQMLRYLAEQTQEVPSAVLLLGNGLEVLQDFTSDPAPLRAALDRFRPGQAARARAQHDLTLPGFSDLTDAPAPTNASQAAGMSANSAALVADRVRRFEQESVAAQMDDRIRVTAQALEAIGRALAGHPGRKSLIWFSRSFPFSFSHANPRDLPQRSPQHERIARVTNMLSDAQVAVYPIDIGGLSSGRADAGIAGPDGTLGE